MANPVKEVGHTDSKTLRSRIEAGEAVQILDVRDPWEHAQGVISGAILIPMSEVRGRLEELLLGSVSTAVLMHAHCVVEVVRRTS